MRWAGGGAVPGRRRVGVGGGRLGQGQRPGQARQEVVAFAHPGDQAQDPPVVAAVVELGDQELAVHLADQGAGAAVSGQGRADGPPEDLVGGGDVGAGEPVERDMRESALLARCR